MPVSPACLTKLRQPMCMADKLFATLDPTLRRISVADVGDTVLGGYGRFYPAFAA